MSTARYIVGSRIKAHNEGAPEGFFKLDPNDPKITTPVIPIYYMDTRNDRSVARDTFSNIFKSSTNPLVATKYESYEAAEAWNKEFLGGEGMVYRYC